MGVDDPAVWDDLAGDAAHGVAGDREADARSGSPELRVGGGERRDADHLTREIDQRAAAVPGIDRRAGLDCAW
jgi:hypothetical protein